MTPSPQSLTAASAPAPVRISGSGRDIELHAFSIEQFCESHSISRGTFYNMRADGTGPRETHAKSRVLISKEAAAEWRTRQ
jgi:hypothetical protein